MSDPFIDLNINNLQLNRNKSDLMANNRLQQHMSNQSMSKPLMSSHLPQLPQQQIRSTGGQQKPTKQMTTEEECDERKKFEKSRKFQIQQKRLQEMSFSRTTHPSASSSAHKSSADHLIANLIQKVETEAKLDKRINNSHKQTTAAGLHVYNPLLAANTVAFSAVHTPNTYGTQYPNVSQNMSKSMPTTQPMIVTTNDRQQQQNNNYFINNFNSQSVSQTHPQNPSLNTTPILQQLFTNNSHSDSSQSFPALNTGFDGHNRQIENSFHYSNNEFKPQMSSNQSMTSTNSSLNSNSEPIFSITSNNNVNRVNAQNTDQSPVMRPSIVHKLPLCFEDISKMPALYVKVWNYVKVNDICNVCDTNKLYPVLLSVGLPQTLLAQLWSVANHTIPGQLIRRELNMTLALIALIQKNSVNPLEEVYKLDSLPIPIIQFFNESIDSNITQLFPASNQLQTQPLLTDQTLITSNDQNILFDKNDLSLNLEQKLSKMCQKLEKPFIEDNITDDDFDDFKSADFANTLTNNKLISEQTSDPMTGSDVNNDDEFDDFKSATISESNHSIDSIELSKVTDNSKPKINTLSDALMSNMSAITSTNSNSNLNPVFIISSENSVIYTQNTPIDDMSPESNSNQIVTNVELSSGSVDKYSVFRELSAENLSTKDDDFGNFLSHTTNCDAESVDSLQFGHQDNDFDSIESISQQIIQICLKLIHKAFNVLVVSHGEDSVLEAIRANDGMKFAFDLLEVYSVVKRVIKNLKSNDKLNDNLIKLIDDIENTWNIINSVFTKASINLEFIEENPTEVSNNSSQCAICCSKASTERPVLTFAGFEYHTSCANLWLNCINPTLPQPLINCR